MLMERGIMWKDYAVPGGTFRENLRRKKDVKMLPTSHPGGRIKELKERVGTDESGDTTTSRKCENPVVNGVSRLEASETTEVALAKA
jgi:hypothetical protein